MSAKTPPAAWDKHALEVARGIASIDRSRLPGSTTQFVAIIQSAIVDAMMTARESTLGTIGNQLIEIEAGEAYEVVYRAMKAEKC